MISPENKIYRTRNPPHKTTSLGILHKRTIQAHLHGASAGRHAPLYLVPLHRHFAHHGVVVFVERHVPRLERLHDVIHARLFCSYITLDRLKINIGTAATTECGVWDWHEHRFRFRKEFLVLLRDQRRRRSRQAIPALYERGHMWDSPPGRRGIQGAGGRPGGVVAVSGPAGRDIRHGRHGETEHRGDPDGFEGAAGHEVRVQGCMIPPPCPTLPYALFVIWCLFSTEHSRRI